MSCNIAGPGMVEPDTGEEFQKLYPQEWPNESPGVAVTEKFETQERSVQESAEKCQIDREYKLNSIFYLIENSIFHFVILYFEIL